MDMLVALYPTLKALWVVCFLLVFLAMLWLVMRPSRKRDFERAGLIPLLDDRPEAPRDLSSAPPRDPA